MKLNLHHFFILVEPGGKSGEQLHALGMKESKSRVHKGQGTSNRRFSLVEGLMLELLWVHDLNEALNGPASNLHFFNRTKSEHASPFGLILCPVENAEQSSQINPFSGWSYQPEYFEPPMAFHIGSNSEQLNEPICIFASFFKSNTDQFKLESKLFFREMRITFPHTQLSSVLSIINETPGVTIENGSEHLMELFFGSKNNAQLEKDLGIDLRPGLPLIIYGWEK